MQEVFEKIIDKLLGLNRLNNITNKLQPPKNAYDYQTGVIDSIDVVNYVANAYNNGWIPCSERLPEGNGNYTVTEEVHSLRTDNRILQTRAVGEVEFVDGKWRRAKHLKITAWQPLPQPYEPKEG